jgi:hypothetical protein
MTLSLSKITFMFGPISSVAVVAGVFFNVFRLRQNAWLIRTTFAPNRNDAAFNILDQLTKVKWAH